MIPSHNRTPQFFVKLPKNLTNDSDESTFNSVDKELPIQEYLPVIDQLIDIKRKKIPNTFCLDYQEICIALGFNPSERKIKMDSMFKKCKAKYCKSIQEALFLLLGDRTKVRKLPQYFVTNINIKYNKKYMNCTLEEIFQDFEIFSSLEYFQTLSPAYYQQIKQLLKKTFAEGYQCFIMSNLFSLQLDELCSKKGLKTALLFYYASHLFLDYIQTAKGIVEKDNKKCDYLVKLVEQQRQQSQKASKAIYKGKMLFSVET